MFAGKRVKLPRETECPFCLAPIKYYEIKDHVRPCMIISQNSAVETLRGDVLVA